MAFMTKQWIKPYQIKEQKLLQKQQEQDDKNDLKEYKRLKKKFGGK